MEWMGRCSASTGGAGLSNVEYWDCGKRQHLRTERHNLIVYPAHGMDHPLLTVVDLKVYPGIPTQFLVEFLGTQKRPQKPSFSRRFS